MPWVRPGPDTPVPMALAESWRGLRVACVVVAAGSTVRAAELLHLSQSSVVRTVQALEAALGWMVFERSAQGMQPTALGQAVLLRAGRAAQQLHAYAPTGLSAPAMPWWASRVVMGLGLRHMRLLLALCATRSAAQAAGQLQVSLPAVHQTLAQLEHLAGSALFLRTRKGIRPTEAGDQLLRAVQLCLAELRQGDEELAFLQGRPQGQLTIGTLPFSTGMLLAPALDEVLRSQGAGLRITIVDGTYDALVHQLRHAEIDLLVGALRPAAPGADLQQQALFEDSLAVVARAGHPLLARELAWPDLAAAQWIMPMPRTPAQRAFEEAFAAAGQPLPADGVRANSALLMQSLLLHSDRLAMMSPRQVQHELQAGLMVRVPVPVQHAPRRIGVMQRAGYLPAQTASWVLEALHRVAEAIELSKTHR